MNVQKVNYQKELDKILDRIRKEGTVPSLLLHSCLCSVAACYVLEYLSEYFEITVFIIIRIFIPRVNMRSGSRSSRS